MRVDLFHGLKYTLGVGIFRNINFFGPIGVIENTVKDYLRQTYLVYV